MGVLLNSYAKYSIESSVIPDALLFNTKCPGTVSFFFFLLQSVTRCSIAVRGNRNCVRLSFDLLSEHLLTKWSQSTSFYGLFPHCHLSRIEDLVLWLHNSDHRIVTSIRLDLKFFIMLGSSEENGETLLSVQNFNVLPKWRTIRRICVWCNHLVAVAGISEWSRDNARRTTRPFQVAQNVLGSRLRSDSVHRLPTEIGLKTLKFCSIIDSTQSVNLGRLATTSQTSCITIMANWHTQRGTAKRKRTERY